MTTMTLAFGTSTPTSTTVVETSTSRSPRVEAAHDGILLLGREPTVEHLDRQAGQGRLLERAPRAPRTRSAAGGPAVVVAVVVGHLVAQVGVLVDGVVVADARAHDEGLAPRAPPPATRAQVRASSRAGPRAPRGS